MIELNDQQRLELNVPLPRVIDPSTKTTYVLVREETFERIQELLVAERLSLVEQQATLTAAGLRAGWDDPEMDIYDREESHQELL